MIPEAGGLYGGELISLSVGLKVKRKAAIEATEE
jgi:hypothetical protein